MTSHLPSTLWTPGASRLRATECVEMPVANISYFIKRPVYFPPGCIPLID